MEEKLVVRKNKTLKLKNVLMIEISETEINMINYHLEKMEHWIKTKGNQPLGPLIQYSDNITNSNGETVTEIKFLRQLKDYIDRIENPYKMEDEIKVENCLYIRFMGREEDIKFAYDKLYLLAYEEGITLKGNSYMVLVEETDEKIIADIFMERKDMDL